MKIYKKLVFAVIFCCVSMFVSNAQNYPPKFMAGVIHLKNGEKVECEMADNTLLLSSPVVYRLSPNGKTKEMDPEKIQSIVLPDMDKEDGVYVLENVGFVDYKDYLKGATKKLKHQRYCLVEYGEISLYCAAISNMQAAYAERYICRKKDADYGVYLGQVAIAAKGIGSSEYFYRTKDDCLDKVYENLFGDYPELCQQIREGKLKLQNMKDIVHEYNVYKTEKSGK